MLVAQRPQSEGHEREMVYLVVPGALIDREPSPLAHRHGLIHHHRRRSAAPAHSSIINVCYSDIDN